MTEGGRKVLSMHNFHKVPILVDERMFHLIVKILGNFYFQLNTIFPRYSFTYIFYHNNLWTSPVFTHCKKTSTDSTKNQRQKYTVKKVQKYVCQNRFQNFHNTFLLRHFKAHLSVTKTSRPNGANRTTHKKMVTVKDVGQVRYSMMSKPSDKDKAQMMFHTSTHTYIAGGISLHLAKININYASRNRN